MQPADCPRQSDLLAILNNKAAAPADAKTAKQQLRKWFPKSYSLWMEHNG